jgi:hypothetical protein
MGFVCISVGTVVLSSLSASASGPATDSASDPAYTNGWTTGSNGGIGWGGAWQLDPPFNTANWGFFIGSSTNNDGGDPDHDGDIDSSGSKAWGIYAHGGAFPSAVRPFNGPMVPGQRFIIDIDNGDIDAFMSVGISLQDISGNNVFEFYAPGEDTQYRLHDSTGLGVATGVPFTGQGLHLEFTLTSTNTYALLIGPVGTDGPEGLPQTFTGNLIGQGSLTIAQVQVWNFSACVSGSSNSSCDVFFNNIGVFSSPFWYVSATNTNDPQANGTAAHPFPHIQDALNVAAPIQDTVLVLDGVYSGPGNTNLDFLSKSITLQSVHGPSNVVIDCQLTGGGFRLRNADGDSSSIAGFTITRAASNNAAIYVQSGSLAITNCIFRANVGKALTGNPLTNSISAIAVKNCLFAQNTGVVVDVGLGQVVLQDSLFVSNQNICVNAVNNSSYANISNCVFRFNRGTVLNDGELYGGAWISMISSLIQSNTGTACSLQNGIINNSTIEYNQGDGYDGLRSGYDDSGSASLSNVLVQFNSGSGLNAAGDASVVDSTFSSNGGTGMIDTPRTGLGPHGEVPQSGMFIRCLTTGNGAGGMGGNGQCMFDSCTSRFNSSGGIVGCGGTYVNCLVANNLGPAMVLNCSGGLAALYNCTARNNPGLVSFSNGSSAILSDSISWGNGVNPVGSLANGTLGAVYSDIQFGTGQPWFGTGCLDANPVFVSLTDSHLTVSSPCLAAGTSSDAPVIDIQGMARSSPPDMGCYEFLKIDSDSDGIPDWWMLRYFGHATGLAGDHSRAGDDADGTGQNNFFKYTAGLNPTNPAVIFLVQPKGITNQQYNLQFNPLANGRTYTPQFSTDLVSGVWSPLTGYVGPITNGSQITMIDTNHFNLRKFYRIDIGYLTAANAADLVSADSVAPAIPSGVSGTVISASQVTLTWAASMDTGGSDLAGYQIYRNGTLIATTTGTSYADGGLSAATTNCYTIVAYDNAGNNSSASLQTCVTTLSTSPTDPASPSSLVVAAVTSGAITINWRDNSNNEVGFQIQRATLPSGPWTVVGTAGANATFYTDRGINSATTYYYQVAAFN